MYTIEMASGVVHDAPMCGEADGYLVIQIQDGESWKAVSDEFSNPANTRKITFHYGEMQSEHNGFTQPTFLRWDGDGKYHIALKHVVEKGGESNEVAQ